MKILLFIKMKAILAKYNISTEQGVLYSILLFIPFGIPVIIAIELIKRLTKKIKTDKNS